MLHAWNLEKITLFYRDVPAWGVRKPCGDPGGQLHLQTALILLASRAGGRGGVLAGSLEDLAGSGKPGYGAEGTGWSLYCPHPGGTRYRWMGLPGSVRKEGAFFLAEGLRVRMKKVASIADIHQHG